MVPNDATQPPPIAREDKGGSPAAQDSLGGSRRVFRGHDERHSLRVPGAIPGSNRRRTDKRRDDRCLLHGDRKSAEATEQMIRICQAEPPNMRVQRTRSSASPPHSPLTRYPLGGSSYRPRESTECGMWSRGAAS